MPEKKLRAVQVKFPNFRSPYTYVTLETFATGDLVVVPSPQGFAVVEVVGHDMAYVLTHHAKCKWVVCGIDLEAYGELERTNVGALLPAQPKRKKPRGTILGGQKPAKRTRTIYETAAEIASHNESGPDRLIGKADALGATFGDALETAQAGDLDRLEVKAGRANREARERRESNRKARERPRHSAKPSRRKPRAPKPGGGSS